MLSNSCHFSGKLIPKSDGFHLEVAPNIHMNRLDLPLSLPPKMYAKADELFHVSYAADVRGYLQQHSEGGIYLEVTHLELEGFSSGIADLVYK